MQNDMEREIDLMRLLFALWQKAWIIILCAIIGGGGAFLYTKQCITPMYRTSVSIYVDNTTEAEEYNKYISSGSLATAQRLVQTYVAIISSDHVLEQVVSEGNLNLSAGAVRGMMSASPVNETEIFRIYISYSDPQMAARVANAIADVAPDAISRFLSGSSTKVIDYAKVPGAPYTPNYRSNVIKGVMMGAALAAGLICLLDILDVRIKDEEELERLFEHPVLGSIPSFDTAGKSGSNYGYGKEEGKKA